MPPTIWQTITWSNSSNPYHPLRLQQGNYSHMEGEVMEGWWSGDDDDDGDDLPSPEANSASRLALPRKNRGWRRLRDGKLRKNFWSGVSASGVKIRGKVGHQGVWDPPRRPPGAAQGGRAHRAPGHPLAPLWPHFWLLVPSGAWIFCDFSWIFLRYLKIRFPAHNKTIQAALLKTASVRVSLVQIMQEWGQNNIKSVWKSRYVWDVSTPPSLAYCLSSSNSVQRTGRDKENFDKLFCFIRCI